MSFKILDINPVERTIAIDWGWTSLNHYIPVPILENPNLTKEEIREILSHLRPERPDPAILNSKLYELMDEDRKTIKDVPCEDK